MFLEGIGSRLNLFSGVWKPLFKDSVLGVICLVYSYLMCILSDVQVKIVELWNLVGVHREVLVGTSKGVLEELGGVLCMQKVIYVASNYYNVLGGFF